MMMEVPERRPLPLVRVAAAVALVALLVPLSSPSLFAQFGPPPKPVTVIKGGTVHVGNGDVIEDGVVVVRGSRIESVGKGGAGPEGATVIDATGMHVYPGLIDVESTLLLRDSQHRGEGNLTGSVADAIDPFDRHALHEALSGGVTTVGIVSRDGLLDGRTAVVKLKPKADAGELLLKKEVAVTATFGVNGDRPSVRLREWKTLTDHLQATKKYVESWEEYEEKLEEYKKELEKLKKEGNTKLPEKKEEAPAPAPDPNQPKTDAPADGEGRGRRGFPRRPRGSLLDFLGLGDATREEPIAGHDVHEAHDSGPSPHRGIGSNGFSDGISYAEEPPQTPAQGGQSGQPGGEKKDEGPKKPARPNREPLREVLKLVLDGKLPVNVYARRAADVVNLLELAEKYRFRPIVTASGEATRLQDELRAAGVPVVVVQPHDLESEELSSAAELDAAGVNVVLTTAGTSASATRHLSLSAAAAIAGGMDEEHALAAITSRAAELLGVADRVGTLEAGKDADVVITRGELFGSATVVERVLVDGVAVGPAPGH